MADAVDNRAPTERLTEIDRALTTAEARIDELETSVATFPEAERNLNRLAQTWCQHVRATDHQMIAMQSARMAELVALQLYRERVEHVEDLSVLQVRNREDDRWKTADCSADGTLFDVKNARRSFSSPTTYSEHCVPSFKYDRTGDDVVISAFLSPYFPMGGQNAEIIWLGELRRADLELLRHRFTSDYLRIELGGLRGEMIPPWLFDYPVRDYDARNRAIIELRGRDVPWTRLGLSWVRPLTTGGDGVNAADAETAEAAAIQARIAEVSQLTRSSL